MKWPWKKSPEQEIAQAFELGCRLIQVSLYLDLTRRFLETMEMEPAGLLAAQVVNYLKGDDITAVMNSVAEPLKSQIALIIEEVPDHAVCAMADNFRTREVVVATLRMRTFVDFMFRGDSYMGSEEQRRIEDLLSPWGREFPDQITPERYLHMAEAYRSEVDASFDVDVN